MVVSTSNIIKIKAGAFYNIFLNTFGQLLTCGQSTSGQLGFFDPTMPGLVPFFSSISVKQIAASAHSSLVLSKNGTVYGFGSNLVFYNLNK